MGCDHIIGFMEGYCEESPWGALVRESVFNGLLTVEKIGVNPLFNYCPLCGAELVVQDWAKVDMQERIYASGVTNG
jgi:hypothetical protein